MNGIEKSIARAVAQAIIGAGHKISVDFERGYDCEEQNRDLTDLDKIIEACDAVDECWFMLDAEHNARGHACATAGWVYFIWGNGDEGRTCVSDFTTNLEPLLESIWPWAEEAECVLVGEPAPPFPTYEAATAYLVGRGWINTNAGWIKDRRVATISDRKDEARGIERHFTITIEPCDDQGFPLNPAHYDGEGFLRTARHEGAVAARMGKPIDACPYAPSDADPARSWLEGHAGVNGEG